MKTKIGIITDPIYYHLLGNEFELDYISHYNYLEKDYDSMEFVLYITTWRGLENEWRIPDRVEKTLEVLEYIKGKTKIVFYSKEDPVDYDVFRQNSIFADVILTSGIEVVDKYKKLVKHDNVHSFTYFLDPKMHNPFDVKTNKTLLFSGSYMKKFPVRIKDMDKIFMKLIEGKIDFDFYDRNYKTQNKNVKTPVYLKNHTQAAIPYNEIIELQKKTKYQLNFNSVYDSNTMCAIRVYEAMAQGATLISNYSIAVNNKFPNVFMFNYMKDLRKVLSSEGEFEKICRQEGIREVFKENKISDFKQLIFKSLNIELEKEVTKVAIVGNYVPTMQSYKNIECFSDVDKVSSDCSHIFYMDNSMYYSPFYIQDTLNDFICDDNIYFIENYDEYDYKKIKEFKINNYVAHKNKEMLPSDFGYLAPRIIKKIVTTGEKQLDVIIPVYNNGKYLLNRCLRSLYRSSIFDNMNLIIVDDGSTCENTLRYLELIGNIFDNVIIHTLEKGGSGSASLPRNVGIELATSEYITFLDPDNEAVNDGYQQLLYKLTSEKYDVVMGKMKKITPYKSSLIFMNYNKNKSPVENLDNKYEVNSIQAAIYRREFLLENDIKMPVGAIGEDTYFHFKTMAMASSVATIKATVHIYYFDRADSELNTINNNHFAKFYEVEKATLELLRDENLNEDKYLRIKFARIIRYRYLEKLIKVKDIEKRNILKKDLIKILELYPEEHSAFFFNLVI